MKRLIQTIKKDINTALDGLAYADLGELRSSASKAAVLEAIPLSAINRQSTGSTRVRSVVLAINQRLQVSALRYAASICQRMNATLDVLCVSNSSTCEAVLTPHADWLREQAVEYRIVMRTGPLAEAIARYLDAQPGILVAVAGSGDVIDIGNKKPRKSKQSYWKSDFPLVVVADQA